MQNKAKKPREPKLFRDSSGALGIGAMIVFIAMILVAGIAASVIIQTANHLEITASTSGDETKDEVGTGLRVAHIEAKKDDRFYGGTWYNNSFHNLSIAVDARAGSRDIDMSTTIIEISNNSVKCILSYNTGEPEFASSVSSSGLFSTNDDSSVINMYEQSGSTFGVIVLKDGDDSASADNPVINRGDMVKLTINATATFRGILSREDIWGQVIPEEGSPGVFTFRTPCTNLNDVRELY